MGSLDSLQTTIERAAPLICAGLGVSVAFRAGLFNIGAEGQMLLGGAVAGYIGFHYDLPPVIHVASALLGALVVAALRF